MRACHCAHCSAVRRTAEPWRLPSLPRSVRSRGCLPRLDNPGDVVPTRNASGYDLSQKDPARHPRWDHIVNIVDRNGRLIESWEQHNKLFVRPHKVKISPYDPEKHVWLVEDGGHQVHKFTNDGKTLRVQGTALARFGQIRAIVKEFALGRESPRGKEHASGCLVARHQPDGCAPL